MPLDPKLLSTYLAMIQAKKLRDAQAQPDATRVAPTTPPTGGVTSPASLAAIMALSRMQRQKTQAAPPTTTPKSGLNPKLLSTYLAMIQAKKLRDVQSQPDNTRTNIPQQSALKYNKIIYDIQKEKDYQEAIKTLDETKFRDKYNTSPHRYKYDTDAQYRAKTNADAKISSKQNGTIDFPNSDIRSKSYVGNPNLAFMNPNGLTGQAAAENEKYHMGIIGAALPIPGLERLGKIPGVLDEAGKLLSKNKIAEQASRFDHNLKNNPNLIWKDAGDGLFKPFNTKSGKLLQDEYIDNLKSYYGSPEFKRIMREHYPDVNIETYKQKTLQNLENPITYNPKETGDNLGVFKSKSSSDAAYVPGYTPTFKQKVNNANTNVYSSNDRGKSYLKAFDATDHELSHQRTNSSELLPNFLTDDFLKKNVKPEINNELDVVKDLGENSVQYDNFNYQTKPTEFEVRLRQLKEDLKSNGINDYFNKPVTEGHINTLLKPELEQTKQETDLFTNFNKTYRDAKNKGIKDVELQKIKDKYFEDLDKINVKKHNISGDSQDLLKYYTPKFLSEMANKLPTVVPFYLYLQNQNKEQK